MFVAEVPSRSDGLLAEALHAEEIQNRREAEIREEEDFVRLQVCVLSQARRLIIIPCL